MTIQPNSATLFNDTVAAAWRAFERANSVRVKPSIPILFFGDLCAYFTSKLRVLTVGKNPSLHEFPSCSPFLRFPKANRIGHGEIERYLGALSDYFRTVPYRGWFNAFEPLLNGMGVSYYDDAARASTALHTDICSPVATDPTWNCLAKHVQETLETDGNLLWCKLVEMLRPQVVVLSFKCDLLSRIRFEKRTEWKVICGFNQTKDGKCRKRPYEVCASRYTVGDKPVLFVYGPAAQKPFGSIGNCQKRKVGEIVLAGS